MKLEYVGYCYAPLTSVAMHKHPYWEIVVFLKGTGIHTIGYKSFRFRPNMIILQPPEIEHGTVADDKYEDMYIAIKDFVPPVTGEVPIFMDDEENRFRILADIMHSAFHKRGHNYEQIVQSILQTLYQIIVGWSGQEPKSSFVDLAINEMIVNFSNPKYSASHLSKSTNYTSDHFRRLFKHETGKTPTAYLIDLRMEHAKKLLKQKDKISFSIKDIALLCGFSDPYYFSRLFKEKTGISPTEYSH